MKQSDLGKSLDPTPHIIDTGELLAPCIVDKGSPTESPCKLIRETVTPRIIDKKSHQLRKSL
jgi:hypothetical protein